MRIVFATILLLSSELALAAQTVTVKVTVGRLPFHIVSTPSAINCPGICEAKFRQNETVVLKAVPDFPMEKPEYFYVEWGGACRDPSFTCTLNVQRNLSVTAVAPLNAILSRYLPSPVLQYGDLNWPETRYYGSREGEFGYNEGVIQDFLTGLLWMRDANCMQTHYPELDTGTYSHDTNEYIDTPGDGAVDWPNAVQFIEGINSGSINACTSNFYDDCLHNGGAWTLPTKDELESLVDERFLSPMISNSVSDAQATEGDPFLNVSSASYWSSTPRIASSPSDPTDAWVVSVGDGSIGQAPVAPGGGFHPIWLVCKRPTN